jgi:hypothetical protein
MMTKDKRRPAGAGKLRHALSSPIGLVLVGALAGALLSAGVPRAVEAIWPSTPFQFATAIAYQNTAQETYFVHEPDWKAIGKWKAECEQAQLSTNDPFEDGNNNACYDLSRFGGVDQLKFASITVTNPQDNSVVVTQMEAIVTRRVRTSFAASFKPPAGGPIGNRFGFNLDQDSSLARYVKGPVDFNDLKTAIEGTPYFEDRKFEIQPHHSDSFAIAPYSSVEGIVEWKIRLTIEEADSSGERHTGFIDVTPQGLPFHGVGKATGVVHNVESLQG